MTSRKLAMPLLGVLLWVISIHAGTFAAATLLPRPITGIARSQSRQHNIGEQSYEFPLALSPLKIQEKDLNRSVSFGNGVVSRMLRLETNLASSDIHVKRGTPQHGQLIANYPERDALKQGRDALVATKATIHLMNSFCHKHGLSPSDCSKYVTSFSLDTTPLEPSCKKFKKVCNQEDILSAYRSIDGSCNNKGDGSKGASFTSYKRLLFPEYLDGVQEPRRAHNKKPLPSARLVSTSVINNQEKDESHQTMAVVLWGQFVEHDLSYTAISKMVHTEKTIECCTSSGYNLSPRYVHPFCAPIAIPWDDHVYSQQDLECMTYVRSVPAFRSDCSFGPVEQLNQATHYLDASEIYGSTSKKTTVLRSFVDGQLEITDYQDKAFLPISLHPLRDCQVDREDSHCFLSGDSRVNTHPQLTTMHTLWVREHNRIAKILQKINSQWDDETVFEEARRIVIAEIQHITYNEWIPEVLGKSFANKINKYSSYDAKVDPSVSNSFATAAIRAIDSLLNGNVKLYLENRLVNVSLNLKNHYNKPDIVEEPGYFDSLIRGIATQPAPKLSNIHEDVTNHLFSNGHFGYDIFSLDIQRGRDHGLPPYTSYRTLCGLPEVKDFEDLEDVMSSESIRSLSKVYTSPNDIDLIVGGLLEKPFHDSQFGPTFSCIIADQFLRTRRGDRYYYKNEFQPSPLSLAQIREIEKVSLARIFCDNGDNIENMQPHVFRDIDLSNRLVDCQNENNIPRMNLKVFKDDRETYF